MGMIVTPFQLKRRAELYHQLGATISAGLPIVRALEMISTNPAARDSRQTVHQLIRHINAGCTFTESLQRVQGWIPAFDIAMLAAGEMSGRLDSTFKLLASYYETRAKLIRDLISSMLITAATLHVFLLVFPIDYLVGFVKGIINNQYEACIPFLLEKFVAFGGLYGLVFFSIYAAQGQRSESWRETLEGLSNVIPVLRTGLRYLVLSRLAGSLEALISSGVSIINAWELSAQACGSPSLRQRISRWKVQLERGVTPAEMVNQTPYFPQMFANLYHTAEQSGQLDDTLKRLQIYYQEEGFRLLQVFSRIFNGTLYGLMALLVGYNVIRFWMNYYSALMNAYQ